MDRYLHLGCKETITVPLVRSIETGEYVNDATLTWTLKDTDDSTTITGGTGTLPYVTDSDGTYVGSIPASVTSLLTYGEVYYLHIAGSVSGTPQDLERIAIPAVYRTGF